MPARGGRRGPIMCRMACPDAKRPSGATRGALRGLALVTLLAAGAHSCSEAPSPRDPSIEPPVPDLPAGGATVVRVTETVDAGMLALIQRAVRSAKEQGHDVLVLDMDTPGGEVETMFKTGKVLREVSKGGVRTVCWVHDHALSAGMLLALACDRIYATSDAAIGAATPILGDGSQIPDDSRNKIMSSLRAQARAWAVDEGRPTIVAEAMIDPDLAVLRVREGLEVKYVTRGEWDELSGQGGEVEHLSTLVAEGELLTLTGTEAAEVGFIEGLANTLDDVLERVGAGDREPLLVSAQASERLLRILAAISPLLIGLGIAFAFTEAKAPGFGISGILALVCFGVAFAGRYLVGLADVPHIVLVGAGFALVLVELFAAPGTIWFGLAGGILILGGLFLSQLGPGFSFDNPLDVRIAYDESFRLVLSTSLAAVAVMLLGRYLARIPGANRLVAVPSGGEAFAEALPETQGQHAHAARVGELGVCLTALRPVGKVRLDRDAGLEFEARAPGELLEPGDRVRVVEVHAGRLVVEPESA